MAGRHGIRLAPLYNRQGPIHRVKAGGLEGGWGSFQEAVNKRA